MTYKFLAIAAMSLSLGATSALAQTAQTGTTTGTTTGAATGAGAAVGGMQHDRMPTEWEGSIGDAFYSDTELGTLHGDDEMRSNWEGLDEDDRTAVRDYCEQFAMDDDGPRLGADAQAGAATGTVGTATDSGTVGSTGTAGAATGTGTAGTAGSAGAATDTGTAGTTGSAGAATDTGTAGTTGSAGAATDTGAAMATADLGADMHKASLRQICDMIEDDNS